MHCFPVIATSGVCVIPKKRELVALIAVEEECSLQHLPGSWFKAEIKREKQGLKKVEQLQLSNSTPAAAAGVPGGKLVRVLAEGCPPCSARRSVAVVTVVPVSE